MTYRPLAMCLVAAALAAAGGSAAAQPLRATPRSQPITLGRVNVIKGAESGVIDVRIPADAKVDITLHSHRAGSPSGNVSIEGSGRAVGVALAPPPPVNDLILNSPRFFISGRFGACDGEGCDPGDDVVNFQEPSVYPESRATEKRHTLVAGDYRLFLIADGEPVRIRLVLDGLKGKRTLEPTEPAAIDLKTPTVHGSHLGGPSAFSAGDTFAGGRRGVAFSLLSLHGSASPLYSVYGMCGFYRHEVDVPDPVAYGPNCHARPGGSAVGSWSETDRFDVVFLQGYADVGFPPTDYSRGHGVWFESHNEISKVTSHIFTMGLD